MNTHSGKFDAIVIGSGISGGWAAKELCEKGLQVLVLERGKDLQHGSGYRNEHIMPWEYKRSGKRDRQEIDENFPVQKNNYTFDEMTQDYFINDKENPYQSTAEKPYEWFRAAVVGGRSILWGRQTYRFSEQDFNANKMDGNGSDWPLRYKDIAPWYDYVESYIGVSGNADGLVELPDGKFLKPMPFFPLEQQIKSHLKTSMPELSLINGRTAVLTENHNGRFACHYCGPCSRGCSTGSYFSSLSSTLPAAKKTGNLTIRPNSLVEKLHYDEKTKSISKVQVIDTQTNERFTFSSKLVFVCASTIASTQILLNSTSERFPDGIGNTSGVLGHYLMDHHISGAMGIYLDKLDQYVQGIRPTGSYIPRFRNLAHKPESTVPDFVRGYGYQLNAIRLDWRVTFNTKGFGKHYKDRLRKPGPWAVALSGFGETLPNKKNTVSLDENKTDKYGIPQIRIHYDMFENEINMQEDLRTTAESILKNSGAVFAMKTPLPERLGIIHEMGTARMGNDPSNSYLNAFNQNHEVSNLFVTDGSAMASSSCVNPSVTYMALTARACDYAVTQLKAGAIKTA